MARENMLLWERALNPGRPRLEMMGTKLEVAVQGGQTGPWEPC